LQDVLVQRILNATVLLGLGACGDDLEGDMKQWEGQDLASALPRRAPRRQT
jgi:hypothetical protein